MRYGFVFFFFLALHVKHWEIHDPMHFKLHTPWQKQGIHSNLLEFKELVVVSCLSLFNRLNSFNEGNRGCVIKKVVVQDLCT